MKADTRERRDLTALLKPASVAIVGASEDPERIGGRPLRYLIQEGFKGRIFPVNPARKSVQGLESFASVAAIPESVDLAVIAVAADKATASLEQCADKGIKAAVVFSAGFAETGAAGRALQDRLSEIARDSGMRILGPNCLGIYNSAIGFYATFTATLQSGLPKPTGVGLVSQSGAYGSHVSLLAIRRGIGVRYWITTGNECDVELGECIACLAADPDVRVIVAYAEGIRDRDALLNALSLARSQGKPVVFMKVGRSDIGAEAATSHTAALAGTDAIYDAVLRQFGAYRAGDTEELLDVTYACAQGVLPKGPRVGFLTISGGVGIQMADAAVAAGLDVAAMPDAARERLRALLPFAATRNPVDATAQVFNQPELIDGFLDIMLECDEYDAIVVFLTYVAAAASMVSPVRRAIENAHAKYPERLIALVIVAPEEIVRDYEQAGCLVFEDPTRAVRAIAALHRIQRSLQVPATRAQSDAVAPAASLPEAPVGEQEAKRVLARAGVPMVADRLARTPAEAAEAARALGLPVALKIASADIAHKTELDGVRLGIDTAEAAAEAFTALVEGVARRRPDARIDGVLVSPMVGNGIETILGVHRDPVFGPVIMCGLGGVLVEVLDDVSFRAAPFDEAEAQRMVLELKGRALLEGARGRGPYDIPALCAALAALSRFAAAHAEAIESVDINPFVVLPRGQGAVGLDALIVPGRASRRP
ncbi:MAG: CoA-binding protein [Gammaproteobacteria bacterium]|nr:CoA-binding protein [Gammaproteobacteria bacterium]NIM74348.1 CoA-binding protein [Gammaproteobacteria bacterium]NIO26120.1 CoA-binding protein [Gammaproteobacteria bacterium]NIO66733.1 CoA-binding protein [Gammaproteobacteria bacterium]NIP45005.1 acetate--CoA ligase family protein [Gammaproteobacteria bacterium]